MEELKKKELYKKLHELSEVVADVCSELHDMADNYLDMGEVYSRLSDLALDADELSMNLNDNKILGETATYMIFGERVEVGSGDDVGLITSDGKVEWASVKGIRKEDEKDENWILLEIERDDSVRVCSALNVIKWWACRSFNAVGWNKMVECLASQEKSVSLSSRNGQFDIVVTDKDSNVIYRKSGLELIDIRQELVDKMKNITS